MLRKLRLRQKNGFLIKNPVYSQFATGEIRRSENCTLVASNSVSGWFISGPDDCTKGDHNLTAWTSLARVSRLEDWVQWKGNNKI